MKQTCSVDIEHMPANCIAYAEGNSFSVDIAASNQGYSFPCKTREEIINGIKQYLKQENLEINAFSNRTPLDITIGELIGESLKSWF